MSDKLSEGIQALRAGNRPVAYQLLKEAVVEDPTQEKAWLWLSGATQSLPERLQYLEKALALNPHNEATRQSILELEQKVAADSLPSSTPSPTPAVNGQPPQLGYQSYSNFDDIWAEPEHYLLCAYCAQQLKPDTNRCPKCGRNLVVYHYQSEKPSSNFHIYWVLILSLSQLFLLQGIADFILDVPFNLLLVRAVFVPIFAVLALFIFLRQFWAYAGSVVAVFIAGAFTLGQPYFYSELAELIVGTAAAQTFLVALGEGMSGFILSTLRVLLTADLALSFVYGIFLVGADFSQIPSYLYARLSKGVNAADHAHIIANRFREQKMVAAAALHWQKAVALDPYRILYQLHLAEAFAELGFFERSLNTLSSATHVATTPAAQAKIKELTTSIQAKAAKTKPKAK
jgi:tetratricopeptide (TPR) repeat protein